MIVVNSPLSFFFVSKTFMKSVLPSRIFSSATQPSAQFYISPFSHSISFYHPSVHKIITAYGRTCEHMPDAQQVNMKVGKYAGTYIYLHPSI